MGQETQQKTELLTINIMGRALVVQDGSFGPNAIYSGSNYEYINNSFTWGKGGISTPGVSSGSTNKTMSMVGLPLEYASEDLYFFAANGYKIGALLTSNYPSPGNKQYSFVEYSPPLNNILVPSGQYYEIAIETTDGTNADLSVAASALLLRREIE